MIKLSSFKFEKQQGLNAMFVDTFDREDFIKGKAVEEFEQNFANTCKTKHCVTVGNCTDALRLTLQSIGVGPGTSVITTPFTWISTLEVVKQLGAKLVLVDVDDSWCIDPDKVKRNMHDNTKAIIGVDIFGQQCDWSVLNNIGVTTICDAAQSAGLTNKADYSCHSFYPTKNLSCLGDGGAVVSNNDLTSITQLRNHGQSSRFNIEQVGWNSRLDSIQAELLNKKLQYLTYWNMRRNDIAEIYKNNLTNKVTWQPIVRNNVYHQFVILTEQKNELKEHLKANGVESRSYYDPLPSANKIYNTANDISTCVQLSKTNLAIPCNQYLTDDNIHHIIKLINDFL